MRISDISQSLASEKETLQHFKVARLWLFGSAARKKTEIRDLDFLVEFSSPPGLVDFMELKFFLENRLGLPVDLHSRASCPERFFRRIEPDLQHVA